MSLCKAGCGAAVNTAVSHVCDACAARWRDSGEFARMTALSFDDTISMEEHNMRGDIAFVDFCTRMRLERQNGAKP